MKLNVKFNLTDYPVRSLEGTAVVEVPDNIDISENCTVEDVDTVSEAIKEAVIQTIYDMPQIWINSWEKIDEAT